MNLQKAFRSKIDFHSELKFYTTSSLVYEIVFEMRDKIFLEIDSHCVHYDFVFKSLLNQKINR